MTNGEMMALADKLFFPRIDPLHHKSKVWLRAIIPLVFLLTAGCGGGGGQETATPQVSWTVDRLLFQTEKQEISSQQLEVKHCENPEPYRVECPAGGIGDFTYDLAATNYTAATLAPSVVTELGAGQGQDSYLDLAVPPAGFIFRYQVSKQFQVVRGEAVALSSTNEEKNLQYTFVASCQITTQSREQLDCETGQVLEPTTQAASPTPGQTVTAPPASPTPGQTVTAPPAPTVTPTLSPTPVRLGQNCATSPGDTFAGLWSKHRTLIGCPTADAITIPTIAEEAFEGGHLFWRSDTDQVYIIYDRRKNGEDLPTGDWELNPSWRRWDGSDPDGVGLRPPPGLAEPKRGFGWLWRNHLEREAGPLGWALDREYGFDNLGQVQQFEQGLMFKGSSARIYVLADAGQFFTN